MMKMTFTQFMAENKLEDVRKNMLFRFHFGMDKDEAAEAVAWLNGDMDYMGFKTNALRVLRDYYEEALYRELRDSTMDIRMDKVLHRLVLDELEGYNQDEPK